MIDLQTSTVPQQNLQKRMKSRTWFERHLREIQEEYGEKWIAVTDERLVASGSDPAEVKEKIAGQFPMAEVLLIRVPTGEISRPV